LNDIPAASSAWRGSNSNAISAAAQKEALIVDDDVRARELLSEFCRGQGFGVATAHHGQAAIAAITRDPGQFAVIFPDLNVPAADAFDVVRAACGPIRPSKS
jgi:CheY-like chemotaxis protein